MSQTEREKVTSGAERETDPLRLVLSEVDQLQDAAKIYLATHRDQIILKVRQSFRSILVSAALAIALLAVALCAIFIFLSGLASGVADLLDRPQWLGEIVVATAILLSATLYFFVSGKRSKTKCCARTRERYTKLLNKQKVAWLSQTDKDEQRFLEQTQAAALNRIKTQIADAPDQLQPVMSLQAWSDHHPWITVGSSALAGSLLGRLIFGDRKTRKDTLKAAHRVKAKTAGLSSSAADVQTAAARTAKMSKLVSRGIDVMAQVIQASLVAYASAQSVQQQTSKRPSRYTNGASDEAWRRKHNS